MPPKSQREKMLAGETYTFLDPELMAVRRRTKELLRRYNLSESESERTGIVRELTGKRRNRLFGYDAYLTILNEGTEDAG